MSTPPPTLPENSPTSQSLAALLEHTRNNPPLPASHDRLAFLKNRLPGHTTTKLQPRLPSGLSVEEGAALSNALAGALRRLHRAGQTLGDGITPADVQLRREGNDWQADFGVGAVEGPVANRPEQVVMAGLLYKVLLGPENRLNGLGDLKRLDDTYPETAEVLEKGWRGVYSSAGELAGAFGWSLYRRKEVLTAPPVHQKSNPVRPRQAVRQVIELAEAPRPPATPNGLTAVTAWISLGAAMLLLLIFIIYSVASSNDRADTVAQVSPTPAPTVSPTPTVPTPLETSRQDDGAYLTRFQAAYAAPGQFQYKGLQSLKPGEVQSLSGPQVKQIESVAWPPGSNLYLSLKDGGWEVWDTMSKTRISRRELSNPDQYITVSWSPDGENFAAITLDGQLRLGTEGRVLKTVPLYTNVRTTDFSWQAINYQQIFSWSPDSNFVLISRNYGSQLLVWSFAKGPQQLNAVDNKAASLFNSLINVQLSGVAWSGDSRYLAIYSPKNHNQVLIYSTKTLAQTAALDVNAAMSTTNNYLDSNSYGPVNLAWSPDGQSMALLRWYNSPPPKGNPSNGADMTSAQLFIWNIADYGNLETSPDPNKTVLPVKPEVQTFDLKDYNTYNSFDGGLLGWGGRGLLGLVTLHQDADNKQSIKKLQVYSRQPDDDQIKWKLLTESTLDTPAAPNLLSWSPGGSRILLNDTRGNIYFVDFDRETEQLNPPVQLYQGQQAGQSFYRWQVSPDNKLAASQTGQGLTVQDNQTLQTLFKLDGPDSNTNANPGAVKWSPDGHYLAALYTNYVTTQVVTSSGSPLTRQYEPIIRVWQIDNNQPHFIADVLLPNDDFEANFDWYKQSQKPQLLFEIGANRVGLWDLSQPQPSLADQRKLGWVINRVSANNDPPAGAKLPFRVFGQLNVPTTQPINNEPGYKKWSPDWSQTVTGQSYTSSDYSLYQMYLNTPGSKPPAPIRFTPPPTSMSLNGSLTFSPNGKLVAIGQVNGLVNVYDSASGKLVQSWVAHQGGIESIEFSPDGKTLATTATDRTVKVWDTTNWRLLNVLRGFYQPVVIAQWLNDNQTMLLTTEYTGSLFAWKIKS